MIANKQQQDYGIYCEKEANSCLIEESEERTIEYRSKQLTYNKSSIFLRLTDQVALPEDTYRFPLELLSQGRLISYFNWGVVGLQPHSYFS